MEKDFGTPVSDFPKGLEEFSKNISKRLPKSNLHNMYEIELTDLDGNKETYYGCNLMTDYFFKSYGYGGSHYNSTPDRHIYLGNGIDVSHQPDLSNSSMFNNLTTTFKSESSSSDFYGMTYDSVSGDITDTKKIFTTTFDYNIDGIAEPVVCNEIGFGPSPTTLYSHSKIYDKSGNEKTITKNPNQSLTVILYWRISVNKTLFESLWNQKIYGLFSPRYFLWYDTSTSNNVGIRLSKPGSILMNNFQQYSDWDGYYLDANYYPFYYNTSSSYSTYYGATSYDDTTNSEVWSTNTVSESRMKYLMERRPTDFFSMIEFGSDRSNPSCYYASYSSFYFMKPYKMNEYEDIETYVRTDRFDDSKFYDVLGVNTIFYARNSMNTFNYRNLRGKLPVTDLNIQSLCRYNFETNDWDIPVAYDNPYNNDYERLQWFQSIRLYVKCPDDVTRYVYVFVNIFADNVTSPVNIKGFYNGGEVCYCTDEWWDTSTWETIIDYTSLPQSQQKKKYYITSWTYSAYSNNGNVYNINADFRWWRPKFEYVNGLHQLQNISSKETVDNSTFNRTDEADYMISNESADFYVLSESISSNNYNNIMIKKVSENVDINLKSIITANFLTYFTDSSSTPDYYTEPIYLDNGMSIWFIRGYRNSSGGYYGRWTYPTYFNLFILDLNQTSTNIASSLRFVKFDNTFSPEVTDSMSNSKLFKVGGKYIGLMPLTMVGTGYECAIYDVELDSTWVIPDKLPETVAPVYGRNEVVSAPGGDLTNFTVYDVSTQTVVDQFTIPSEYSIDTNMIFAFDDFVYIRCTYGTSKIMLLYNRQTQTLENITIPSVLSSNRYAFGSFSTSQDQNSSDIYSMPSWHANVSCQYKEGIVLMSSVSDTYMTIETPVLIFSKYNPKNIIVQKLQGILSTNYDEIRDSFDDMAVNGMCLKKMYGSYYGFIQCVYRSNNYYNTTQIFDIGRIVRNDEPLVYTSETVDVDSMCYTRNGLSSDGGGYIGYYHYCKYIPFGNYIYARNTGLWDYEHTYKLPFDTFITYKIHLKTKTCTRWNNPKLITIPTVSISITNHV